MKEPMIVIKNGDRYMNRRFHVCARVENEAGKTPVHCVRLVSEDGTMSTATITLEGLRMHWLKLDAPSAMLMTVQEAAAALPPGGGK